MRRSIFVVLCSIAFSVQATAFEVPASTPGVDLDQPGALDALKRDKPAAYDQVMKKVDEVQAAPRGLEGLRNLGFAPGRPGENGRLIAPMDPAKARVALFVDGEVYRITIRYTKDPAQMVPAR